MGPLRLAVEDEDLGGVVGNRVVVTHERDHVMPGQRLDCLDEVVTHRPLQLSTGRDHRVGFSRLDQTLPHDMLADRGGEQPRGRCSCGSALDNASLPSRRAQGESRKDAEQGKEMLRARLAG